MLYPRVTLTIDEEGGHSLRLHPDVLGALNLAHRRSAEVHLGQGIAPCELNPDSAMPVERLTLGAESASDLHLTAPLELELRPVKGGLELGPTIGCLLPTGSTEDDRAALALRLLAYPYLRGQVIAFETEGLDIAKGLIRGHIYDPKTEGFIPGEASIPKALYILPGARTGGSLPTLRKAFGGGIINLPLPLGADVLGALKAVPVLRPHLKQGGSVGIEAQFTLYLQRDQSTFFRLSAFLARPDTQEGAALVSGTDYLIQLLEGNQERAYILQERMTAIALEVSHVLETLGAAIAEVVVDINLLADGSLRLKGLPRALKVPEVALALGDGILFYRLLSTPIFYAKAMAGYPFASS